LATLKFGSSFYYRKPVTEVLGGRIVNTAILTLPAVAFGAVLGIIGGAIVGWSRRGSFLETAGVVLATALRGIPAFVTGIIALSIFAYWLEWFPASGMRSPGYDADSLFETLWSWDFIWHWILPVTVLTLQQL